jgi:hypothetical protein
MQIDFKQTFVNVRLSIQSASGQAVQKNKRWNGQRVDNYLGEALGSCM